MYCNSYVYEIINCDIDNYLTIAIIILPGYINTCVNKILRIYSVIICTFCEAIFLFSKTFLDSNEKSLNSNIF